jgi:hypothetical protein
MSSKNVNEKGIVLPKTNESEVEQAMEEKKQEVVEKKKEEMRAASMKALEMEIDGNFLKLMEEYEIPTLVPIAKVVNIAPQQLYSRRKRNKETGEYEIGEAVERVTLRAALQNTDMTTIEEVMQAARAYLDEKEAIRAKKKANRKSSSKKKSDEPAVDFKIGDKVEYDTFRASNGVREYYVRKGEIVDMSDSGYKAKIKTDDGAEVDITCKNLRLQGNETTEA